MYTSESLPRALKGECMTNVLYEEITRLQKIDKGFHTACDYIYVLEGCPYQAGHDPKYAECALFPDCGCDGLDCTKRYRREKEGI